MSDTSALAKAMGGQELSDRQTKGALSEALDKLGKEGGKLSKLKDNIGALGDAMIYSGEMQGTVFIASFTEGYLGEEKMDIGPVDLRLAGGVVTSSYGLYNVMMGKGGEHALAVGNGLLATGLGRVGRNAGKALAEKKDKGKTEKKAELKADQPPADPKGQGEPRQITETPPTGDGTDTDGDFGAFVRDIFLTPDGDRAEGHRGGAPDRGGRHAPTRFIRATVKR